MEAKSDQTFIYLEEHKQLVDDWMSRPYIDITIKKGSDGCPIDYEALFYRRWNGTYDVCDSVDGLKVYDRNEGCNGSIIDAIPPVNMTSITDMVACAKRGGPNFLDTIRPDPKTLKCPYSYVPCS